MNNNDLELQLVAAGRELEFPDPPDIAHLVMARINSQQLQPRWIRPAYVVVLAVAALIIAASGILILSPDARRAVADLLRVPGVGIQLKEPSVSPPTPKQLDELGLGQRVSFEEAEDKVEFDVRRPTALGSPEIVLYRSSPPGGMITLVYEPNLEVGETSVEGVGLLLTQFKGRLDSPYFQKAVGSGSRVQEVLIEGRSGFWIEGTPHLLTFRDAQGEVVRERARLAGNVLLWDRNGVTFRIEGDLGRELTIRIAESME